MNYVNSLYVKLNEIKDPRMPKGLRYKFQDILLLIIYAILAGCENASDIAYYVELNFNYFKELINLGKVPSHDTFSRILKITNFDELSKILNEWLNDNYPEIIKKYNDYSILHVDGKAVRAASEKSNSQKPVYLLNAVYEGGSIKLYSSKVGDKENEITNLPFFLKMFNLEYTIVTIDAMGDNNTIISSIVCNDGDYLTIVKENQGKLYKAIKNKYESIEDKSKLDTYEVIEKDHGRIDAYKMTVLDNINFIYEELGDNSFYSTIGSIGILNKKSSRKEKGEWIDSYSTAYIITSIEGMEALKMLEIKRSHWNIEMEHWLLDVEFNEDKYTARKGYVIENASAIKRFAMHIKKCDAKLNNLTLRRFFIHNSHDIENISRLLFIQKEDTNKQII